MSDLLYNRIAVLRAERNITRRQLAQAVGVHYQTVGYLERGEYSPSLLLALRIAEFFGVPVELIFSTRPFLRIGEVSSGERLSQPAVAISLARAGDSGDPSAACR